MTTLLEAVNVVLSNSGERRVTNTTSLTSLRARDSVLDALREFETLNDWKFTRQVINATSWANGVATLPAHQRIHSVFYKASNGTNTDVAFLDNFEFDRLNLFNETFTFASGTLPEYYTIRDETKLEFLPYPTDTNGKNAVYFDVTISLVLPTTDGGALPLPERHVPTVIRLACSLMATRHLDDLNLAQQFRSEFENLMRINRSRENPVPTRGVNLYDNMRSSRIKRRRFY